MIARKPYCLVTALILALFLCCFDACRKDDKGPGSHTVYLTVGLPQLEMKQDLYYSMDHEARSIEIRFSEPLKTQDLTSEIRLTDKTGALGGYTLSLAGSSVVLSLNSGNYFRAGWQYFLLISSKIVSAQGHRLPGDQTLQIRTSTQPVFSTALRAGEDIQRNSLICISDVHMGQDRAVQNGYCWFDENAPALLDLAQKIENDTGIREMAIIGDFMDEWIIPFATKPFEGAVTNDDEYFKDVRNAPVNKAICDTLADIAAGGVISLTYVPGNHDMLLSKQAMEDMFPGVQFIGDGGAQAAYQPVQDTVMEHGHHYDFFNSPQPLVNPPNYLAAGFFVSRMWASGMEAEAALGWPTAPLAEANPLEGIDNLEFQVSWTASLVYTVMHFPHLVPPDMDAGVIEMNGLGGYAGPLSYNGARDMYVAGNIEGNWPQTQIITEVPVPLPKEVAIANGFMSDYTYLAEMEYLANQNLDGKLKVVVFGHTHHPLLSVYSLGGKPAGIAANTGSWVNESTGNYIGGTSAASRTFVVITPAQWTGSNLDIVTLYQYNPLTDGSGYQAVKLAEESLDVSQ